MADKELKVKVTVDADVQPTLARLKELKQELKEISTTDPKFKQKQQEIDDYTDALKAAKTGAGNFAEVLGTIPGPLGAIGSQIGGTLQSLKQFGALKFSDIKTSFTELGKDVIDAGKGIANLTGLTKVYTVTNNALSKSFFGVAAGETAAATAAGVLTAALAATGITLIIGAVALLVEAYKNWAGAAEKAAAAQKTLNERAQKGIDAATNAAIAFNKSQEELDIRRAKVAGQTEDQIQKIRERAAADRIRIAKEGLNKLQQVQNSDTTAAADATAAAQDELTKLQLDGQIARNAKTDAANKIQQQKNKVESDKEIADKKKALEDIAKNEKAAALSLLDEREQEKRKIVNEYNDQIKLAAANGADTVILEEAKLNALRILNDKFKKEDEDALKSKEDFAQYEKQLQIATIKDVTDRAIAERQSKYDKDLSDLEKDKEFIKKSETEKNEIRKNLLIVSENDINKIKVEAQLKQAGIAKGEDDAAYARLAAGAQYDLELQRSLLEQKKTADDEYYASQLSNENLTAEQIRELNDRKLADQIFYTEKSNEIEKSRVAVKQKALDDIISIVGAESDIGRAALIAKQILAAKELILEVTRTITFSAQAAARSTVAVAEGTAQTAKVGFPQNIPLLIGYAAQAVGIIMAIKSAVNSAKASATGNGSNMPSISAPPAPTYGGAPTIAAPQIQTTGGMNPTTQLSQTITGAQRPIKAYVVSGEISSQQALDRRTSRAATFSAG